MTSPRTDPVCGDSGVDAWPARRAQNNPASDIPGQLRRRRVAAWRLEPLESGRRDPLDSADEPLTDAELDSWRAAWCYLDRMGLPAVIPDRVLVEAGRKR
jgi:hypothetical protein